MKLTRKAVLAAALAVLAIWAPACKKKPAAGEAPRKEEAVASAGTSDASPLRHKTGSRTGTDRPGRRASSGDAPGGGRRGRGPGGTEPASPRDAVPEEPAPIPPDIPAYPGATTLSSQKQEGIRQSILMSSPAPAETVFDFYRQALAAEGWEILEETTARNFYTITARRDGRLGVFSFDQKPGETILTASVRTGSDGGRGRARNTASDDRPGARGDRGGGR